MLISFDRTGFPLVAMEGLGIEVHLLPVTKWQFEQFLAEMPEYQPAYDAMLKANPAVSPEEFGDKEREQLFMTGILPPEIDAFAHWLGEGYELPTFKEWQGIYRALSRKYVPSHNLASEVLEGIPQTIVSQLIKHLDPSWMVELALMKSGLVEWVYQEEKLVGLGAPRPTFHPNLWHPLHNVVQLINDTERVPYFGFRLVQRGEWYLTDVDETRFIY